MLVFYKSRGMALKLENNQNKICQMKKSLMLVVCYFGLVSAFAQNPVQNDETRYCAKLKDGVMVIMQNDLVISNDVTLRDSSKITKDGVLVKKNGNKVTLKEDECIDADGNILVLKESKKAQRRKNRA
jgi:hypothetical protein